MDPKRKIATADQNIQRASWSAAAERKRRRRFGWTNASVILTLRTIQSGVVGCAFATAVDGTSRPRLKYPPFSLSNLTRDFRRGFLAQAFAHLDQPQLQFQGLSKQFLECELDSSSPPGIRVLFGPVIAMIQTIRSDSIDPS